MAYLGRGLDKISNIEVLDNITFDGSSSYSITKGSVAFTPNSAQSCLISIDGVVQATNFTVSSSTIDFGVAVPSTSTCNFFLHYGTGVAFTPSDGSVTTAKLGDDAVTSAKMFSGFSNGITMADQWRLTTNFTGDANPISSNLERVDTAGQGTLGTGMTESSGVFTFPSTGIYLVQFNHMLQFKDGNALGRTAAIQVTTNNSSYTVVAQIERNGLDEGYDTRSGLSLIDVTDIANVKVSFKTLNMSANDITVGQTTRNDTYFTFIRLGDT